MKIIAVVNTHNRISLLKENIHQVRSQTIPPQQILVINNGSTDGTAEWLHEQKDIVTITQPNEGGSQGFFRGFEEAFHMKADWIWMMDDDTIPLQDTLERFVDKMNLLGDQLSRFGFFSSKVIWTDGSNHIRNRLPVSDKQHTVANQKIDSLYELPSGTFVSMLVSRLAIEKVGLPIKDFFIWYDDVEFSERIVRAGFAGGFVEDSVVIHKTGDNLEGDIFSSEAKESWKHFYGVRNELYIRREKKGLFSYYRNVLKRFLFWPFLIFFKRKSARWKYITTVWKGTWASFQFSPKKEMLR